MDDIVDFTEEAADFLGLYQIEAPMEQAGALTKVLVASCEQLADGLEHLPEFKDLDKYWIEIHRLENEGDRISRDAVASLFSNGDRPDGRDPLEGHLRGPRERDRRDRGRCSDPRGNRHQELVTGSGSA